MSAFCICVCVSYGDAQVLQARRSDSRGRAPRGAPKQKSAVPAPCILSLVGVCSGSCPLNLFAGVCFFQLRTAGRGPRCKPQETIRTSQSQRGAKVSCGLSKYLKAHGSPKGTPKDPKDPQRLPKEPPKTSKRKPRDPQRRPKEPPKASKKKPWIRKGSPCGSPSK